ncbi:MAG: large conductance mechanosensitive channel protein MscL [Tissierellia bacterium]|jgi:large conductance mechanosensitive channel|nr:large conductance mechanosensitive channel protein MscL [Tissierellia bacterium]
MLQEFKDFINRGNVIDMAVGVVIGGAFGAIVSALVDGIVMPIVSLITGGGDFGSKFIALDGNTYATLAQAQEAGAATLNYGALIQSVIDFLIISFVIFIFIKQINKLKKAEPEADPTTKTCPFCKTEIDIEATRCPNCTSELVA